MLLPSAAMTAMKRDDLLNSRFSLLRPDKLQNHTRYSKIDVSGARLDIGDSY